MKITIEIDCDDDLQDVKTHLSVCREQIVKSFKKAEKENNYPEITMDDSNCYGTHSITMVFDSVGVTDPY